MYWSFVNSLLSLFEPSNTLSLWCSLLVKYFDTTITVRKDRASNPKPVVASNTVSGAVKQVAEKTAAPVLNTLAPPKIKSTE